MSILRVSNAAMGAYERTGRTQKNAVNRATTSIQITDEAFRKMMEDGEFKNKMIKTIREDAISTNKTCGGTLINIDENEYNDDANPFKSWAVMCPIGVTRKYMEIMNAMADGDIEAKDIKEYSKWEKYFEERGLEFERILSDEELEQVDRQESETQTDIIVKPDGSRVLMVTMNIGGMKTTMSLEISKPTEAINEISEHDTDINITSGDTGMDAASDEMSNVSTEF